MSAGEALLNAARMAALDPERLRVELDIEEFENDLSAFYAAAWRYLDPATYQWGWHIDAICEHLMAVNDGEIKRLLINVPPRFSKSRLVSTAWPIWTWTLRRDDNRPLRGAQVKFLTASYGSDLIEDHGAAARNLIETEWFDRRWGRKSPQARFRIDMKNDTRAKYVNNMGGERINQGLGGAVLGRGGDIRILDDPHKTNEVENAETLETAWRNYREMWSTRITNPAIAAEVIIMQRLAVNDISGQLLESDRNIVHLMLPMEFEPDRCFVTQIGWVDPRGCDEEGEELPLGEPAKEATATAPAFPAWGKYAHEGELLWPERFGPKWVKQQLSDAGIGPHAWAGQFQQRPAPRGGGLIKTEWWKLWTAKDYPDFEFVLASLDGAHGEKQQNDPSALVIFGMFRVEGRPAVMLKYAFRKKMGLNALVAETERNCRIHKVDTLLIENKGPGIPVATELRRLFARSSFNIIGIEPKGDKYSRLESVEPLFAAGIVWAPDTEWAQMVIDEVENFPRGRYDDLTDATSQALQWLRLNNLAQRREEYDDEAAERDRYRPKFKIYAGL